MKRLIVLLAVATGMAAGVTSLAAEKKGERDDTKTVAYLGVATEPVDPALARHLKLKAGEGLVVRLVDEKSPAAKVIQEEDILKELNGQWLVNPEQLRTVVRMLKPGDEASLVVIREGETKKIAVKLAGREVSAEEEMQADAQRALPGHGYMDPNDMMRRMFRGHPGISPWGPRAWPQGPEAEDDEEAKADARGGTSSDDENVSVNFSSSTTISENGQTVTLSDSNGKKNLKVTKGGKTLFDGPVNTDDQIKALKPEIKDLYDKVSKQGASIKVETRSSGKGRVDI